MGVSSGKERGRNPSQPKPAAPAGLTNPDATTGSQSGSRSALNADGDVRTPNTDILPGSYVRHAKYGRGLVLRREGSGDQTKFTVSFPGYGQKKLIEKYANLEKG
jgi:DNA helicase-2/ATP-dependent DNA helicase PcrA